MTQHTIRLVILVVGVATIFSPSFLDLQSIAQPNDANKFKKLPSRTVPKTPEMVEGQVIVKYKDKLLPFPKKESLRAKALNKLGERLSAQYGFTIISTNVTLGTQLLKVPEGASVTSAISQLEQDVAVEFAEPNYKIYPLASPNDPEWENGALWGLVQVKMMSAWSRRKTAMRSPIAVIDTGIDYGHPDLKRNIWNNPSPTFGDVHGASYCDGVTTGDPMDNEGHGTMVAGTIAAVGNNSRDIVGVAWRARLIAVEACSVNDLDDAIVYAYKKGKARVINISLGTYAFSHSLQKAIHNAGEVGVVIVAAAGNELNDNDVTPLYPASFPFDNVIAVAATDENDKLWVDPFCTPAPCSPTVGSNWGKTTVHLAAPGVNILSTFLAGQYEGLNVLDGTSMAAPHVAGCAALLLEKKRTLKPRDLRAILIKSGDLSPDLGSISSSRRLNCDEAIRMA